VEIALIEFFAFPTPNCFKVWIFLEEAEIPYRVAPVALVSGDQFKPEFLAKFPNNKIPAIVDEAPPGGGAPIALFESGAILHYLADKTGKFLPADLRGRWETLNWLVWQVAGLGPNAGQTHYFSHYAPEKVDLAIKRFVNETARLYDVLNFRLASRGYIAGEYSIADMACYPWIVAHARQSQDLNDFPNVKRWFECIRDRPAVIRAYKKSEDIEPNPVVTEAAKTFLFRQTAAAVREFRQRAQQ
jgi:GSH-dependent disulfide-bond oxidoreductase